MIDYETLYSMLFVGINEAVGMLMRCENTQAIEHLMALQQEAEALVMETEEKEAPLVLFEAARKKYIPFPNKALAGQDKPLLARPRGQG
nr:hypothetical protein [bacterium]